MLFLASIAMEVKRPGLGSLRIWKYSHRGLADSYSPAEPGPPFCSYLPIKCRAESSERDHLQQATSTPAYRGTPATVLG